MKRHWIVLGFRCYELNWNQRNQDVKKKIKRLRLRLRFKYCRLAFNIHSPLKETVIGNWRALDACFLHRALSTECPEETGFRQYSPEWRWRHLKVDWMQRNIQFLFFSFPIRQQTAASGRGARVGFSWHLNNWRQSLGYTTNSCCNTIDYGATINRSSDDRNKTSGNRWSSIHTLWLTGYYYYVREECQEAN